MIIKCPECGQEISDKAKVCIHCGYPIENILDEEKQKREELTTEAEENINSSKPLENREENYCETPIEERKIEKIGYKREQTKKSSIWKCIIWLILFAGILFATYKFTPIGNFVDDSLISVISPEKLSSKYLQYKTNYSFVNNEGDTVEKYAEKILPIGNLSVDNNGDFQIILTINNSSNESIKLSEVSAKIDGLVFHFDDVTIHGKKTRNYLISSSQKQNNPAFTVGEHHIAWYIGDKEVQSDDYEVVIGMSGLFEEKKKQLDEKMKLLESVEADFRIGIYNSSSDKLTLLDELSVNINDLGIDEKYVPVVFLQNNSEKEITISINCNLDDYNLSWDNIVVKPETSSRLYSSIELTAGNHFAKYYIDSFYVGESKFTVSNEEKSVEYPKFNSLFSLMTFVKEHSVEDFLTSFSIKYDDSRKNGSYSIPVKALTESGILNMCGDNLKQITYGYLGKDEKPDKTLTLTFATSSITDEKYENIVNSLIKFIENEYFSGMNALARQPKESYSEKQHCKTTVWTMENSGMLPYYYFKLQEYPDKNVLEFFYREH